MFVLDNLLFMVDTCYITYECSQMSLSDPRHYCKDLNFFHKVFTYKSIYVLNQAKILKGCLKSSVQFGSIQHLAFLLNS